MRYGESSHSHQLQNSLRRSLCDHSMQVQIMRNASNPNRRKREETRSKIEDDQASRRGACKQAHTVLASELVDAVDEAVVQIGRPSQAGHLGPVVLPHAPAPLPADHSRPHHGHLPVSDPSSTTRRTCQHRQLAAYIFAWMSSHFTCTFMHMSDHPSARLASKLIY